MKADRAVRGQALRHHAARPWPLMPRLVALVLLAGCNTSTPSSPISQASVTPRPAATPSPTTVVAPTAVPSSGPCPNLVMGTATVPPSPAPTPMAAASWTTYANTTYHYSIEYPASWFVPDTSPTQVDFGLWNFNWRMYHPGSDDLLPPPYNKIEIEMVANAQQQTPRQYQSAQMQMPGPLTIPACSQTLRDTTVGGHVALEVIQWPISGYGGPAITYPEVSYLISDGAMLVWAGEYYSPGGVPSPTFARMVASLTFSA